MTRFETLTLLVALIGVVVSVVSLVRTRRLDARQRRLHEKQEQLTDLQLRLLRQQSDDQHHQALPPADVRVSLEPSGRSHRFVISNWGHGSARNVNLEIKLRPGQTEHPLVSGDYDQKLPIPELLPGDRVRLLAALTFGSGTTFDVTLTWTDPGDSAQRREMQVSL